MRKIARNCAILLQNRNPNPYPNPSLSRPMTLNLTPDPNSNPNTIAIPQLYSASSNSAFYQSSTED